MYQYSSIICRKESENFLSFMIKIQNEYKKLNFYFGQANIARCLRQNFEYSPFTSLLKNEKLFVIEYSLPSIVEKRYIKFNIPTEDLLFILKSESKFSNSVYIYTKKITIEISKNGEILVDTFELKADLNDYIKETAKAMEAKII